MLFAVVLTGTLAATSPTLPPDMPALLEAIRGVESSYGADKRDGDPQLEICLRSVGDYQVTPRAVRHLVKIGRLKAEEIPGFSLTNCSGIRAWLKTRNGGRRAAYEYLILMLEFSDNDIERALASWNCGYGNWNHPRCLRFAGQVLNIVSGEQ